MEREWLIYARKKRKLTQREMGRRLKVTESYYNMIENGKRKKNLDLPLTRQLSRILGIGIEQIILAEEKQKQIELLGIGE